MGVLFSAIWDALFGKKLELVLLGLEGSGKSTLLQVLAGQVPILNGTIPTLGSQQQQVQQGDISIKAWDIGGQERFRNKWVLYAENCDCILFVVDSADSEKIKSVKRELHALLENEVLCNLPLVCVSNKIDIDTHLTKGELMRALNLDYIDQDRQAINIIEISALKRTNIDQVLNVLKQYARSK